jgi:glyoxylase-like metal-dependent hydrolase (beta-lactamase superfamily II)
MGCRRGVWFLGVWLAGSTLQAQETWREVTGEQYTFIEVKPGVWHVRGSGTLAVGSNGAVIVNDDDVLLVDSHMTPAAARALLADLPRITDKPIRSVVNTHFHFDHVHGNQVFGTDVEIMAHEFTYEKLAAGETQQGRGYETFIGSIPRRIEDLEREISSVAATEREALTERLERLRRMVEQERETRPTPPTLTLREAVTLYRGGREIQLFHWGRGHTGGDVLVYLPAEKVLVAGDVITGGIPYMGDGFFLEWADLLDALRALPVDVVLPGHGRAFTETARFSALRDALRDLWGQLADLHAQGVSAEEAARRVDLTAYAERLPGIDGPGVDRHAVDRAYELLDTRD